jgi:hypothetical protein
VEGDEAENKYIQNNLEALTSSSLIITDWYERKKKENKNNISR